MVSQKKRVLRNIVIIVLSVALVSFAATKIIYDSIFTRYDAENTDISGYGEIIKDREKLSFKSGKNELCGYIYGGSGDTLIVIAPGMNSGTSDYLAITELFIKNGYGVFIFDTTGSCESEGKSSVGFPQELTDLENALDHIEANGRFGYKNLVLFGYSRGGYAAVCALDHNKNIDAVVAVAGANSAMEAVNGTAENYIGVFAYGNYPMLWLYQTMLFGAKKTNIRADEIIEETDIPILIIQGASDSTVKPKSGSIYSYKDKIKSGNAEFYLIDDPGFDDHTKIIFGENGINEKVFIKITDFYARAAENE